MEPLRPLRTTTEPVTLSTGKVCCACFLEGVQPLTLQALIEHYIDTKVTNLATINSAIQSFPYSYMEVTDKLNREKDLHGSTTLNQDAAKCYLLFRIFRLLLETVLTFLTATESYTLC